MSYSNFLEGVKTMQKVSHHSIRNAFVASMSDMYKNEVPAYGDLVDLVEKSNAAFLAKNPNLKLKLTNNNDLHRISEERHGAIRLGTASELNTMRQLFAIMGMFPVAYYDLTIANLPVHSTAFRPLTHQELAKNPFRVFTSLLRLDLIKNKTLSDKAKTALEQRQIFSDNVLMLIKKAQQDKGLNEVDAQVFVQESVKIFKWHDKALVDIEFYKALHDEHPLIADIVCFKGPHINHLTPRSLDIDDCQKAMPKYNINPKATIEGPPKRNYPILLRQTAFKALTEVINFYSEDGNHQGSHTARFGEIEQRGVALTKKGRILYDDLLNEVKMKITPNPDGSNAIHYCKILEEVFTNFPDDEKILHDEDLAYYSYSLKDPDVKHNAKNVKELLDQDLVVIHPIIYEDFLPVSAAGIFHSNLSSQKVEKFQTLPNQAIFEQQLGAKVFDDFQLYETIRNQSIQACLKQ